MIAIKFFADEFELDQWNGVWINVGKAGDILEMLFGRAVETRRWSYVHAFTELLSQVEAATQEE